MKNKLFLILVLFSQFVFSQEASFEFLHNQNLRQIAFEAIQDTDGNYVITSGIGDEVVGNLKNQRLWKLDENGNVMNWRDIEYEGISLSAFFLKEVNNNYVCIGEGFNEYEDNGFVWIAEFNTDLDLLKDTLIHTGNLNIFIMQCNEESTDDNITCVANFRSLSGAPFIPFAFTYSVSSENIQFNNVEVTDLINDIIPVPGDTNNYILNGQRNYKVDKNFNVLSFTESSGVFDLDQQGDIHQLNDSTFLKSGKFFEYYSGERLIGFGMADYDLNEIKLDTFGKTGDTIDFPGFSQSIDFVTKDKIYCGGTSNIQLATPFFATVPSWFVLAQYDSLLNQNWERYYGGDAYYGMYGLIASRDGGCLMYGFRHDYQNNPDTLELYALKVSADGELITSTALPLYEDDFVIYPNPFSEQIRIDFSNNISIQNLQIELYDLQGRLLTSTKTNSNMLVINTNTLAIGAYICFIKNQQGEIIGIRKIVKSQ